MKKEAELFRLFMAMHKNRELSFRPGFLCGGC
jgi:hypothetical protein